MRSPAALVSKDLRVTVRSPLFAILSVLVPVAFTMLYAIVIHVSTTAPVAVAVADDSPEAGTLVEIMRAMHNDDGPYYEIRTTDPAQARRMFRDGEVGALLTIPAGFGAAVRAGDRVVLPLEVVTSNADSVKNQQLRLAYAVREFNSRPGTRPGGLAVTETPVLDHDIPITVYLGTALMVLAALYAGIVNAGTLVAREWEERTAKGLLLSPAGGGAFVAGKWLSAVAVSTVTVAAGVLGVAWILDYPVSRLGPHAVGVLAVVWLYGAAIGILLGVALRRSLPLIPIAVIIAVGHFLVSGYESYIRGFAHGGAVEPLWRATAWIPLARLVDSFRFEVAGLPQPPGAGAAFGWSVLAAALLSALAFRRLRRTITFTQAQ